jgi:hypothetical protein
MCFFIDRIIGALSHLTFRRSFANLFFVSPKHGLSSVAEEPFPARCKTILCEVQPRETFCLALIAARAKIPLSPPLVKGSPWINPNVLCSPDC